ncbi:Ankyrin and armadillo repeat-containing protein [Lamellibrachia satsuma]|nr:Ankyrin and armadillo repeat-containing protein [Lamellibrachia satsuma]
MSTHAPTPSVNPDEEAEFAQRMVAVFFEKFSRFQLQEFLGYTSSNWMLSTDDIKVPSELPLGLISQMLSFTENFAMYLIPADDSIDSLDMREIHQILRELVIGIYVCNQLPSITLDANFDESTSCQIPPAYIDTRVGQVLISIDYMLKALWHGAYMPKEKRTKFTERWRSNLDVNTSGQPETKKPLLPEFHGAGLADVLKQPEYALIGESMQVPEELFDFFRSHVDKISLRITVFQQHIFQHRNLFCIDADWFVSSIVDTNSDLRDHDTYERLNNILQLQEDILKKNLENSPVIRKQMIQLRIISFLVPFLCAMKKRMSLPILMRMLPSLFGDAVKTEKELPPLMVGPDYMCKNFYTENKYFNMHGGIQLDYETPAPERLDQSIIDAYNEIDQITTQHLKSCLDQLPSILPEAFPIRTITINGVKYYAFKIEFETFYAQYPPKPKWVQLMMDHIVKTKPKRLPIHELTIHEHFKKVFGTKQAIKCKVCRLQKLAERVYPEAQCGFHRARSTIDMLFSLRQLQEKFLEQPVPLYIAFIDLNKAFNLVSRNGLFQLLEKIG